MSLADIRESDELERHGRGRTYAGKPAKGRFGIASWVHRCLAPSNGCLGKGREEHGNGRCESTAAAVCTMRNASCHVLYCSAAMRSMLTCFRTAPLPTAAVSETCLGRWCSLHARAKRELHSLSLCATRVISQSNRPTLELEQKELTGPSSR